MRRIRPLGMVLGIALIGISAGVGLTATACGTVPHRSAGPQPQRQSQAPTARPSGECTVSFRISGINAIQVLGEVHATVKGPSFSASYTADATTGPAVTVPCGSSGSPVQVTLTATPDTQAKAFRGWTVSGDGGRYRATRIASPTFTFDLTGDTQVYAEFSY